MKKFFYTFVVLFACALTVSAQKVFESNEFGRILSYFTFNHIPYLTQTTYDDSNNKVYHLYNLEFNHIQTFVLEKRPAYLSINEYIDKNGISYGSQGSMYFSQTLFNDDEEWEYVDYEDEGYAIKKLNGTVIGYISKNWTREFCIINDVVYTYTKEEKGEYDVVYTYYTISEFRKLIGTETGVQAVPAFTRTISKETYDLAGRKSSDNQRGIVVKDGKKMLVK